jgi:hypothetical protein
VFQPLRTAISLAVLAGALWAAFTVDLGGRTFAEHVDTISQTPEAENLIEGTRSRINPALQEIRDRVLGEYVEAPTWIPDADAPAKRDADATVPASTLGPKTGLAGRAPGSGRGRGAEQSFEPNLPGRRKRDADTSKSRKRDEKSPAPADDSGEPPLPGRKRSR